MMNNPIVFIDSNGHAATVAIHDSDGDWHAFYNPWAIDRDDIRNRKGRRGDAEIEFLKKVKKPGSNLFVSTQFGHNCTTLQCSGQHPGVDFTGAFGDNTIITPTAFGTVVDVRNENESEDMGFKVIIEHDVYGEKYYSVYGHLRKTLVSQGQMVFDITPIGYMGNSGPGDNTSVHLHLEVRKSTNVKLDDNGNYASFPIGIGSWDSWWADSYDELVLKWVNLGKAFGYSNQYPANWPK